MRFVRSLIYRSLSNPKVISLIIPLVQCLQSFRKQFDHNVVSALVSNIFLLYTTLYTILFVTLPSISVCLICERCAFAARGSIWPKDKKGWLEEESATEQEQHKKRPNKGRSGN